MKRAYFQAEVQQWMGMVPMVVLLVLCSLGCMACPEPACETYIPQVATNGPARTTAITPSVCVDGQVRQVQVNLLFIQIDKDKTPASVLLRPEAGAIIALWTNGSGQLVSAPSVITRSGCEATVKGVSEIIYPTSFDLLTTGTNMAPELGEHCEMPQDFATREVGAILNVLPEVSASGDVVSLILKPSLVEPPTWKDYGYEQSVGRKTFRRPMEQPVFHVYTCETSLSVQNGQSAVALGGVSTRDGKAWIFGIVSARTLEVADGNVASALSVPKAVEGAAQHR